MAQGVYKVTEDFEKAVADYTGAPYCAVVDCCSHAIFLSLIYEDLLTTNLAKVFHLSIPKRTFPSVPCEIIHAGFPVKFDAEDFKGVYNIKPSKVWDCALRFTHNMYMKDTHMCISFTGPRKRLKLTKGGAILTDSKEAYEWFKQARMSGRHEVPFMEDNITFPGWNFYLNPELSARGLILMREFYSDSGEPLVFADVDLEYPDLSQMEAFK